MDFTCVHDGRTFTTLRGWKTHMSRAHGGYDENDVAQVMTGETAVTEDNVAERMAAFARNIPSDREAGTEDVRASEVPPDTSNTVVGEQRPPSTPARTIKATPKRLKKVLAAIPSKMLEGSGIELDDEDREALEEAGEFLSDIFGVEFAVDEQKKILKSRMWAIVWVAGVAALIYVKHRFATLWQAVVEKYKDTDKDSSASV